jgi:hypothetical protein
MSYEHLREQLRPEHARVRAVALGAAAVVGVVGVVSLVWLGPFEPARGLHNPAGPLASARVQRVEEPVACPEVSPAEGHSPGEPVLAFVSLRPTLP